MPALLYRPLVGGHRALAAGMLQATSLSFIVAAGQIGMELNLISEATRAALVAAGLLSVLIFPVAALTLLRRSEPPYAGEQDEPASSAEPARAMTASADG